MEHKKGFTLVELIAVIVIIGILTIIAVFNYLNIQRHARDEQRASDATVVSESLEKYFTEHGEYPSVYQATDSDGNAVKQLLGLPGIDSLRAPQAPSNVTNSWQPGAANSTNTLTYAGNTDQSPSCNTGTAASDRCIDFKIQYYTEQDDAVRTIISRNKSTAINVTEREGVITPDAPVVTVTLSGSNARATVNAVSCQVGGTVNYAFQRRTNDGSWGAWSPWATSTTHDVAANQGSKYGARAKARCVVNATPSADSATSAESTYVRPISTPVTPTVTVSTSGITSTWNWNATACPTGTTARYQVRYLADWGYASVWYGPTAGLVTMDWNTSSQGYEYTIQVQTHCYTAYDTSDWSSTGQASYIRPVSAPGSINFSISRGASNIVYVYATSSCHSSVSLYSRGDVRSLDYFYTDSGAYGWYADSHGGAWVVNNWGYYGDTLQTGASNGSYGAYSSGSRWAMATDMRCRNSTTGRASPTTGRVESSIMYLP